MKQDPSGGQEGLQGSSASPLILVCRNRALQCGSVLTTQVKLVYAKIHLQRMVLNPILYFRYNLRGGSACKHAMQFARNFSNESRPRLLPSRHSGVVIGLACSSIALQTVAKFTNTLVIGRSSLCRWSWEGVAISKIFLLG